MAKAISQETFNDVVKENILDFEMSPDEAKEETIKQFEAQGINLGNIIKDLSINSETGQPTLIEAVDKLKTYIGEKSTDPKVLIEYLTILEGECQKSIPHRVLACKNGGHDAVITVLESQLSEQNPPTNLEVVEKCLKAVNSLTNKQPDVFDAEALSVIVKLLQQCVDNENVICLTLQWLQKACIMHETNRQNIMSAGIMKQLHPLLLGEDNKDTPVSANVTRDILMLFRYLVLDDDIRVEFGCAHEHARVIANEFIVELTKMLQDITDTVLLGDLLLTIGSLTVRQEFCTTIEECGGIKLVLDIMSANPDAARLNREALKLLRALAGNDTVKVHIVQQGAAPIIQNLLNDHMSNENIVTAALACISTLTLRVKDNSTAFFKTGIAEALVETIRLHPNNKTVQRNGAWAIRNMVSRSRDQCETWLSYGVEDLLNTAMTEHPSIKQDIKAALRDLGCHVELKEEWTGTAEKKIVNTIK